MVSTFIVDRFGRKFLYSRAGGAIVLGLTTAVSGTGHISRDHTILVLVLMCVYTAGFGWSWGLLNWLIPSEILPMKIRPTGQNFAATFVLSQAFLTMLCHFKFGTFLFYTGSIAKMTIFFLLFLLETKGIPLDKMHIVWERRWFWRWFVKEQ